MVSPKQTHKQTIITEREGKKRNETNSRHLWPRPNVATIGGIYVAHDDMNWGPAGPHKNCFLTSKLGMYIYKYNYNYILSMVQE